MKPFANLKKILLILMLLCLFYETSYSQNSEQAKTIDVALDNITIEIARQYVNSKKTKFPDTIKSVAGLKEFLGKIYPDENHELRQAVINLQRYKDKFVASNADDIKTFLRNGVKQYAVNRNGKPLDLDRRIIETIINEANGKVNQSSVENETVSSPAEAKTSDGIFTFATDIIKQNSLLIIGVLTLTNICLLVLIIFQWLKKNKSNSFVPDYKKQRITQNTVSFSEPKVIRNQVPIIAKPFTDEEEKVQLPTTNGTNQSDWLVVKTSIAGKFHIENNPPIPCQDSNFYQDFGKGWGIAVVSDGAGSKEFSHLGSNFVAERAGSIFGEIIKLNDWQSSNALPPKDKWHEVSKRAFAKIRNELENFAKEKNLESGLLSCTVIVVIHSPFGVLASHIGDGRAAFCNLENEWKAIIKPYKGEEANQTVFITSVEWNEPDKYIESNVFEEKPIAFALMSDGCEAHSFEVNIFDEAEQKFKDPNNPYPKFFQPLVATLKSFHQNREEIEEINAKWRRFIESGSEKLKNEPDDKTMILGILLELNKS